MRRRAVPPLIALQEPPTYAMDSSAWFNVDLIPNAAAAWALIQSLIQDSRIVSPLEVIDELRFDENLWPILHPLEPQFRLVRNDEIYLLLAGRIAAAHPGMASVRSRKTKADPFVIALAELEHFTVVTDESTKRANRKIPGVCKKRSVPCISLSEMLKMEAEMSRKTGGPQ